VNCVLTARVDLHEERLSARVLDGDVASLRFLIRDRADSSPWGIYVLRPRRSGTGWLMISRTCPSVTLLTGHLDETQLFEYWRVKVFVRSSSSGLRSVFTLPRRDVACARGACR